jgi:hypothetical protein
MILSSEYKVGWSLPSALPVDSEPPFYMIIRKSPGNVTVQAIYFLINSTNSSVCINLFFGEKV